MRKSIVRVVLLVLTLSLGALALSPTVLGAEKKTIQKISASYLSCYEGVDPTLWSLMQ